MSNPVVEIIGQCGTYDGTCYKIEVIGEAIRIEYKLEAIEGKEDLHLTFAHATSIAKQIKTLVNS